MGKVVLQVNDIFSQAWKGCQKPMWFKVLNIDRTTNRIECHSFDGLNVFPEVWSLDTTEIGDYKLVKQYEELKVGDIFNFTKVGYLYYRIR